MGKVVFMLNFLGGLSSKPPLAEPKPFESEFLTQARDLLAFLKKKGSTTNFRSLNSNARQLRIDDKVRLEQTLQNYVDYIDKGRTELSLHSGYRENVVEGLQYYQQRNASAPDGGTRSQILGKIDSIVAVKNETVEQLIRKADLMPTGKYIGNRESQFQSRVSTYEYAAKKALNETGRYRGSDRYVELIQLAGTCYEKIAKMHYNADVVATGERYTGKARECFKMLKS